MKKVTILTVLAIFLMAGAVLNSCKKEDLSNNQTSQIMDLKKGSPTKTAQSVMIDVQGANNFVIYEDQIWAFNPVCAATYFNATGGTALRRAVAKGIIASAQLCTFWDGGTLVGGYLLGVTVTPNTNPVVARTCWNLVASVIEEPEVPVDVDITIAGESYMDGKNFTKYSFDLWGILRDEYGEPILDEYGELQYISRVEDLKVELWKDGVLISEQYPGHTIIDASEENNYLLDFFYLGDAGVNFGANGEDLLEFLHRTDGAEGATLGEILQLDTFENNDSGEDNCIAEVDPISFTLGVGVYELVVTGKVKGNDGTTTTDFSGTYEYRIWLNPCE